MAQTDYIYYKCTACSECLMSEEIFFAHTRTWHCKILVCTGHDAESNDSTPCDVVALAEAVACDDSSTERNVRASNSMIDDRAISDLDTETQTSGISDSLKRCDYFDSVHEADMSFSDTPHPLYELMNIDHVESETNELEKQQDETKLNDQYNYLSSELKQKPVVGLPSLHNDILVKLNEAVQSASISKQSKKHVLRAKPRKLHMTRKIKQRLEVHHCHICLKSFAYERILQAHIRTHTGEKPFGCQTCGKTFRQKQNLTAHERIHTGEKPYQCSVCTASFSESGNRNKHEKRVHGSSHLVKRKQGGSMKCVNSSFASGRVAEQHENVSAIHFQFPLDTSVQKSLSSAPSKKSNNVSSQDRLLPISVVSSNNFFPSREFPSSRSDHDASKMLHQCAVCLTTFSTFQHLFVHRMKVHGVQKNARSGRSKSSRKSRFHSCSICHKSFQTASQLVSHQRVHTGERPFHCTQCTKSFAQRQNLVAHVRTHTGEKPYKCDICGHAFAESGNMKKHRVRHCT